MRHRRFPARSYLFSALALVALAAAGCSTSGTNRSADKSSTTAVSVTTTTSVPATTTTTTTPGTTTDPEFPREDEYLEAFFEDCQTGYDEACDFLYLVSEPDTEYEEVGNTCGGRGDGLSFCTPGLELTADGTAAPEGSALSKLVADCESGSSMYACDLLYLVTDGDSAEEKIGNTCGGRIPEGADPTCTTELGVAVGP